MSKWDFEMEAGACSFSEKGWTLAPVLFEQIIEIQDPEPHPAASNMALDEALLRSATEPTLRVYRWITPALSLGYFSRFAVAQAVAAGREMVRRWTGGGLVEHGQDLTYTLIVPRDAKFFTLPPLESYRLIHERIAEWLTRRGQRAHVAPASADSASPSCFAAHVRYDIVNGADKLAGAAQRRTRWGLLHQGSIQADVRDANGLAEAFAGQISPKVITAELAQAAQQIVKEKYGTNEWLRKY